MKILIVSATPFELGPLQRHLNASFWPHSEHYFEKDKLEIQLLVTGVGMVSTALHLGSLFARHSFDLAINAGIAGAFLQNGKRPNLKIGDVVNVTSERFADLGVEEANGSFTDVHELGLVDGNALPFNHGELLNPNTAGFDFLPSAKGLTINKVHGFQPSIDAVLAKYQADVESMEGAAFFMACLMAYIPFLQIRSISNYVEPRNREAWNLPLAIKNLNEVLVDLVESLR